MSIAAEELALAVSLAESMPRWSAKSQADDVAAVCASKIAQARQCVDRVSAAVGSDCAAVAAVAAISVAKSALCAAGMSPEQARLTLNELLK